MDAPSVNASEKFVNELIVICGGIARLKVQNVVDRPLQQYRSD